MPTLILKFKDQKLSSHPLKKGATISIGRFSSNDIVIDDRVVSGLHAYVDLHGEEITLTDLQSKNGTYHHGERITKAILRHNDEVMIGKHVIAVDALHDNNAEQTNGK